MHLCLYISHIQIYTYTYVDFICRYNMHIQDTIAYSRHLHILIRETLIHIIIDAGQNKTTPGFHCSSLMKNQMLQHTNIRRNVTERWKRVLEVCIYIQIDAESNDNTPAITLPPLHEDIYSYACVCIYKMHILGENTCQVSTTLHSLIREACTHI